MNSSYSLICSHPRIERVDKNFVRCLQCGESMISQKNISGNKRQSDFSKENDTYTKNFDRNFTNVIEEVSNPSGRKSEYTIPPAYEYYSDRMGINKIRIDKNPAFYSHPVKHEVIVNGKQFYLEGSEIKKLLLDTRANIKMH